MATELHIAEHALALHPFLQHFESLVDIVIAELSRTKTCKCVTPIAVKGGPCFESAPRGHVQNGHHTCHRTATAKFRWTSPFGFWQLPAGASAGRLCEQYRPDGSVGGSTCLSPAGPGDASSLVNMGLKKANSQHSLRPFFADRIGPTEGLS